MISNNQKIYQNGSEIVLDLNGLTGKQNITIYDMRGKNVYSTSVIGGSISSFNPSLMKGIYLVRIQGTEKQASTKLVIQ